MLVEEPDGARRGLVLPLPSGGVVAMASQCPGA